MKSFNIITGEKGVGKTTTLLTLSSTLTSPVGFVSLHRGDEYYIRNIVSGEERLLLSPRPVLADRWKGWYVDSSLFDDVYLSLSTVKSGPVLLDECGRMEMEGLGYDRPLRMLIERDADIYITLRRRFLESFLSHYSIVDYRLIGVERRTE